MILPKIVLPSTLQSNITSVTEPHYDAISLSGISIGVILLAINENIIDDNQVSVYSNFVVAKSIDAELMAID